MSGRSRNATREAAELLAEASELATRSAALAEQGDLAAALEVEREADSLRARARRAARAAARQAKSAGAVSAPPERGRSSREVVISSLNELGIAAAPRAVADHARTRFGESLDYRALASLRRDERRTWQSPRSDRPVYVVPALEGRRFMPMRGKLALSIWPLEQRLIGPWSERVDHLTATVNLARQLAWLRESQPQVVDAFARLVWTYAATVPGAIEGALEPGQIEQAAQAELELLREEDNAWRSEAAARARDQLGEEEQFWGTAPPAVLKGEKAGPP